MVPNLLIAALAVIAAQRGVDIAAATVDLSRAWACYRDRRIWRLPIARNYAVNRRYPIIKQLTGRKSLCEEVDKVCDSWAQRLLIRMNDDALERWVATGIPKFHQRPLGQFFLNSGMGEKRDAQSA
jgi:hypothetical protein